MRSAAFHSRRTAAYLGVVGFLAVFAAISDAAAQALCPSFQTAVSFAAGSAPQSVAVADLASSLPFEVDLWKVQNIFYALKENVYPGVRARATDGYPAEQEWADAFNALARSLRVSMNGD